MNLPSFQDQKEPDITGLAVFAALGGRPSCSVLAHLRFFPTGVSSISHCPHYVHSHFFTKEIITHFLQLFNLISCIFNFVICH